MPNKFRLFTKRFFIICNIVVVFFFLLACIAPSLNPQKWWYISFFGLGFPFLLLLVLFFLIGWLIILKPKLSLISGVALLLGIKSIIVFFAFHPHGAFNYAKSPQTIRIVSWNVARFVELKVSNNKGSHKMRIYFACRSFTLPMKPAPIFMTTSLPFKKNWVILIIIFLLIRMATIFFTAPLYFLAFL